MYGEDPIWVDDMLEERFDPENGYHLVPKGDWRADPTPFLTWVKCKELSQRGSWLFG